jgi:subtilase family serine protease
MDEDVLSIVVLRPIIKTETTMQLKINSSVRSHGAILCAIGLAAALSGCGGGGAESTAAASDVTPLAAVEVTPLHDIAPIHLTEPTDVDADGSEASRYLPARTENVPNVLSALSTARLTGEAIDAAMAEAGPVRLGATSTAPPVTVYTPAQVRAAYNMPTLPAATAKPTAEQLQNGGAGQTIYIVAAYNNPNAFADLTTFNTKFGLPACTQAAIPATTKFPLAAAPATSGCVFSVVNASAAGAVVATAPAFNAVWQQESALDVQWAHAMAPYARIVLIQAVDANVANLQGALKLANAMGPGVVSMSFGAKEGTYMSTVESVFQAPKMTYVAATGDSGAAANWPAASSNVLAVSGTTLSLSGSTWSEQLWASSGGGVLSAYTAQPAYQAQITIPGVTSVASTKKRSIADVAMGADPLKGQYTAVTVPGKTVAWYSVGGTSLATPEWSGILAVANAKRAAVNKAPLGLTQNALYSIGKSPATYSTAFKDVVTGTNKPTTLVPTTCAVTCVAGKGYDNPSGLGTPNVTNLLAQLTAY